MRRIRLLLVACMLATLLGGCTLPDSDVCPPGELVAPVQISPAMWAVVPSLTPTLTWGAYDSSLPNPYADCHPDGYQVRFSMGPSFSGTAYYTTDEDTTNYPFAYPLSPGKEYAWSVSATSGGTEGPIAGERYFFTGPYCATDALIAPVLFEPANGSLVDDLQPLLTWGYRNPCLPEGYRVDLSTSPTFDDTSLS